MRQPRAHRRRGSTLLLLAALAAACGRKSPPVAPELVRPHAPVALAASSVEDGVRLTWLRPLRYSGGRRMNDLDRFLIDRAPGDTMEFGRLAVFQLEDRFRFRKDRRLEWVDHDARPGERYAYRVTAVTRDGSRSPPAGPVTIRFEPKKGAP